MTKGLKKKAQRKFRIEDIWKSTTQKASNDIAKAPDGFMVVQQDGRTGVSHVFFMGLETKALAQKLRKQVVGETGKKNVVLMHKLRHHEVQVGWVSL